MRKTHTSMAETAVSQAVCCSRQSACALRSLHWYKPRARTPYRAQIHASVRAESLQQPALASCRCGDGKKQAARLA